MAARNHGHPHQPAERRPIPDAHGRGMQNQKEAVMIDRTLISEPPRRSELEEAEHDPSRTGLLELKFDSDLGLLSRADHAQ